MAIWDIEIQKEYRDRGYGRQAMMLAERIAKDSGATELGLNFSASVLPPRCCTNGGGYEIVDIKMCKILQDCHY